MKQHRNALIVPALLMLAACGDANVYDLRPEESYQRLRSAKVATGGNAIFGRLETSVSGDGASIVIWRPSDGTGGASCEANIAQEGQSSSRITAYCGAGSAGDAASGMLHNMHRKALIEHIDATLTDRQFDYRRAQGSTASGWPADHRQADASRDKAIDDALRMQRESEEMIAETEAEKN